MIEKYYYAGIGSRNAPQEFQDIATELAKELAEVGFTLRSGGANGMDQAFEDGADLKEILKPADATKKAIDYASNFHPAWYNCNNYVRKLHGRNAQIILGKNLDSPVLFVLYWSFNDKKGGTALGLSIARANNIPVIKVDDLKEAKETYEKIKQGTS